MLSQNTLIKLNYFIAVIKNLVGHLIPEQWHYVYINTCYIC